VDIELAGPVLAPQFGATFAVKIFVFEFVTGGGCGDFDVPDLLENSLLKEGRAMALAICEDFLALDNINVSVLQDNRLPELRLPSIASHRVAGRRDLLATFDREASQADWTLVIAPELGGQLLHYCQRTTDVGGQLLGPSVSFVSLASDKNRLCEALSSRQIPVPDLCSIHSACSPEKPLILKRADGAGSQDVRLLTSRSDLVDAMEKIKQQPSQWRLERFCSGISVSVSVIASRSRLYMLPASTQHLRDDGSFGYLGGRLPLSDELNHRAGQLARQALTVMPESLGYVGIDIVLGSAADGSEDVLIEVNPRLTTSYIGLRALSQHNLAAAMLDVCSGKQPDLEFDTCPVEFDAAGKIRPITGQELDPLFEDKTA